MLAALVLEAPCGSVAVTTTLIVSPRSPLPATERSSDDVVAPAIRDPFRDHSYVYLTASPPSEALKSGSYAGASGVRNMSPVVGTVGVNVRSPKTGAWFVRSTATSLLSWCEMAS